MDGFVVVDKPGGLTSHDVVSRLRRLSQTRRVGHAGTLDPLATGVLVLGVRRATRLLTYLTGADKRYVATIRLGASTITDDSDGEVLARADTSGVTEDAVARTLAGFIGEIDQIPSSVSAIKIGGVRSYARVRGGEAVVLPSRRVRIDELTMTAVRPASVVETADEAADGARCLDVDIDVTCSSGTYIRAIARDVGVLLGVGGHLVALRRTRVGAFDLTEAMTLEQLAERGDPVTVPMPFAARRVLPARDVDAEQAVALSHGGSLPAIGQLEPYAVFSPDGQVVAVVRERAGRARPEIVLASAGLGIGGEDGAHAAVARS